MPIFYSKEKKEWFLKDMDEEELQFLVELGKEQFIRNLSLAMVQRFMPAPNQNETDRMILENMPKEEMGQG